MIYQTLEIEDRRDFWMITFNRPGSKNTITLALLTEIQTVLDQAVQDEKCKGIVFQGKDGFFCTGMDFQEAVAGFENQCSGSESIIGQPYLTTLKKFTETGKVVISIVDGQVMAGGVGIVAASDLVFATPRSTFALSEALWGLLPCCVIPFLIRRVGFQAAYRMTLTTQTISADEAHRVGLVDFLNEQPDRDFGKILPRLVRIQSSTVEAMKAYFKKMGMMNDTIERQAVEELNRLLATSQVQTNLRNFVQNGTFPWE